MFYGPLRAVTIPLLTTILQDFRQVSFATEDGKTDPNWEGSAVRRDVPLPYPDLILFTSRTPLMPSMFLMIAFRCATSLMSIVKLRVA